MKSLMRKQLDKQFEQWKAAQAHIEPRQGWIQLIRTALGMSSYQLAKRLGVNQSRVIKMEKAAADHTIKIGTLERAAEAMECDLVFALVPKTSLNNIVETQARKQAEKQVAYVSHSMNLEQQAVQPSEKEAEIEEVSQAILRGPSNKLWSD